MKHLILAATFSLFSITAMAEPAKPIDLKDPQATQKAIQQAQEMLNNPQTKKMLEEALKDPKVQEKVQKALQDPAVLKLLEQHQTTPAK